MTTWRKMAKTDINVMDPEFNENLIGNLREIKSEPVALVCNKTIESKLTN
jgi:hypothetical protein